MQVFGDLVKVDELEQDMGDRPRGLYPPVPVQCLQGLGPIHGQAVPLKVGQVIEVRGILPLVPTNIDPYSSVI